MTLRLRLPSTALGWDTQLGIARKLFRPGYAGFIVASKQISHWCKFSDKNLAAPPPALGRIERLEILLDQTRTPRASTLNWARQEHYYRTWYEALAGSAHQRKICRIVISNIIMETFVNPNGEIAHVPAVTELPKKSLSASTFFIYPFSPLRLGCTMKAEQKQQEYEEGTRIAVENAVKRAAVATEKRLH